MGKPAVKLYHLGLGNKAILLDFFKVVVVTRGYASQIIERQLNILLNANLKIYSKILNVIFLLSFQTTCSCGQKRPAPQGTLWKLKLWHTAFAVRLPACTALSLSPSGAIHSIFCLVARSIISLGICLFLPLPPPPRNLIPSWQAEGQKSLKGTTPTAHAQVLPLHMLPNASFLSSLLHHILFLCDAQVVT